MWILIYSQFEEVVWAHTQSFLSVAISYLTRSVFCTQDEIFGYCRFSPVNDENQVLYITTMRGGYVILEFYLNYLFLDSVLVGI